jgi:hypothetical protein
MTRNRGERALAGFARLGLTARTGFYLLLVYLVARIAVEGAGTGQQANAHGALATVAGAPAGCAAIVATAVGFFAFGAARVWGAVRDDQPSLWHRTTTFLQGAFYLALTWIPLSYATGRRSTGSEQQHRRTVSGLLQLPLGRELTFAVGLVVVAICANQIRTGLSQGYVQGMDVDDSPRWVRGLLRLAGTVGIPARAVVFLPVGVFFMVAAVRANPQKADGLDQELAALSRHAWGQAMLAVVAVGLVVFALYSGLEARYRTVTQGS